MYSARSLYVLLITLLCGIYLSGCEGGKSQGLDCRNNQSPYEKCDSPPKPCPSGQQWIGGKCQVPNGNCPIGQTPVNGICVPDNGNECGPGRHLENGRCVTDQLSVEIISRSACWNPNNGASRIILQFVTRDESGWPLDPEIDANKEPTALLSQLLVNDEPPDVEALLSRDSELLKSDMALSLVLDSTYSMLRHNPPAFEPMKSAAVDVLQELASAWNANNSNFFWELTWFNDLIYRPATNNRGEGWQFSDILNLPEPVQGSYTGLWKAVDYTIGVHEELLRDGKAAGNRDQHVMVIFSDGEDNHSTIFDNSADRYSGEGDLQGKLFWTYQGYPITDLASVKARLAKIRNLRVYVIAFGNELKEQGKRDLRSLAEQSRGQYFFGSDSKTLGQLFNSVKREFITMQTIGIETPLRRGEHRFTLHTKHLASGAEGKQDFVLQIDEQTLGTCPTGR
ncbi:VWA domain-containing protein [Saccharophagus sp. K07]|uniref:VWA domain-containing protein n=1 Tax=Saccharophagus sp. K07 TaxID=2283636 RepID=UPI001652309C|nr:VWA domain-containing protein [Saccharophagus sp. K07]MBC6904118.1 VWA domain-containing protein [Saccharophagus sp. K07]